MAAPLRRVLVVVGTTGAGKTKLSIELAKAVGGEIVNSDAMQMYRGLDIATAKVTEQEKEGVPHHLFDVVEPWERCDVLEFKTRALRTIEDILARGKVPILVGGTMYYTHSVLWKSQLLDDVPNQPHPQTIDPSWTPEQVYRKLQQVDPEMAKRWHVKQTRRVRRSLEVFFQTGIPQSQLIAQQHANASHTTKLFDACALWIQCDKEVLGQRLEKRIQNMMETGLLTEIERLREVVRLHPPTYPEPQATHESERGSGNDKDVNEEKSAQPNSVGILQAIGYKEFAPYFEALERGDNDVAVSEVLQNCIDQLNAATRQYARRQLSWIRNRFATKNIPVFAVDSSNVSQWGENVTKPALQLARAFLAGEDKLPFSSLQERDPETYTERSEADRYAEKFCDICGNRRFIGAEQWTAHLRSRGHRYHLKRVQLEQNAQSNKQRRQGVLEEVKGDGDDKYTGSGSEPVSTEFVQHGFNQ